MILFGDVLLPNISSDSNSMTTLVSFTAIIILKYLLDLFILVHKILYGMRVNLKQVKITENEHDIIINSMF